MAKVTKDEIAEVVRTNVDSILAFRDELGSIQRALSTVSAQIDQLLSFLVLVPDEPEVDGDEGWINIKGGCALVGPGEYVVQANLEKSMVRFDGDQKHAIYGDRYMQIIGENHAINTGDA